MAAVAVSLPAPYEASDGRVEGRAPGGAMDIGVYVSGGGHYRLVTMRHLTRAGRFAVPATGLPAGDRSLRIVAFRDGKVLGSKVIRPVSGLPQAAFRIVAARRTVAGVQRGLKGIGGAGVRAVWMRGMASGDAASYNAGARFAAASTLKLGILMTSLAHNARNPVRGPVWDAYLEMVLDSDNASANTVERQMGGSTSGGSAMVNAFCHRLGCSDTDMFGGYTPGPGLTRLVRRVITSRAAHPIPPVRVERAPFIATYGKHTTAHDLGMLLTGLVQAAAGKGVAHRAGISRHEARVAIWLLIHARYPGLVRPNVRDTVAHKAGWLGNVQHDAALVFTAHGTVATVIMSQGGVSLSSGQRYGRRVLRLALARLR
jgi:hypothetical protein